MTDAPSSSEPAKTVYLHIGTLKSGTSYLQAILWRSRAALAAEGVLFPGERRWGEQVEAVRDLLAEDKQRRRQIEVGAWDAMAGTIRDWDGPSAIVSMELLSLASPERVERVLASLRPADVHAVITARDLARVVPSSWQESVQNRQTWTWEEYVDGLTGAEEDESRPAHRFWRQQDIPRIAGTWADALGPDHVHLVVVPAAGGERDELWRRFAGAVGVDPEVVPAPDNVRGNPSIGAASAEFLRRLNLRLGKRFDIAAYEQYVKKYLAKDTLALRDEEERLSFPPQHQEWAAQRATDIVAGIRELGIDVRGDLDELVPAPSSSDGTTRTVSEEAVAAAGVHAIEALVRAMADPTDPTSRPRSRRAGQRRQNLG